MCLVIIGFEPCNHNEKKPMIIIGFPCCTPSGARLYCLWQIITFIFTFPPNPPFAKGRALSRARAINNGITKIRVDETSSTRILYPPPQGFWLIVVTCKVSNPYKYKQLSWLHRVYTFFSYSVSIY